MTYDLWKGQKVATNEMFSIPSFFLLKTFFLLPRTLYTFKFLPSASFYSAAVQCNAVWKREEERKKKGTWYLATSGGYNSPIHTSVREETAATGKDRKSDMFS
jgi:hypothetical protein